MIADKLGISKSGVNDYLESYREINPEVQEDKKLKLTFLDLESSPSVAVSFGRFKQNISQDAVLREGGNILTYSYAIDNQDVQGKSVDWRDAADHNDEELCIELWDIVENSSVIVAHNALGFDWPLLKARMLVNGLPPMRKVKIIDTLVLAREFKMNSNKLDSLCRQLDIGQKMKHSGIDLWVRAMHGDESALQEMLEYNIKDVELLRELYYLLAPHSTRHPNLAINFGDTIRCNVCTSPNVQPTGNTVSTNLSVFEEYKCECGSRFKNRKSLTTKDERSKFLSN